MEIKERRTVITFACDGACDNVGLILCPPLREHMKPHYIDPTRYRVTFWWTAPDSKCGLRIEIVGHRMKVDGTVSQKVDTRTIDIRDHLRNDDIPDWLRLVVDVDLYDRLPDWASRLWDHQRYARPFPVQTNEELVHGR